jgi:hypothetical protein
MYLESMHLHWPSPRTKPQPLPQRLAALEGGAWDAAQRR